MRWARLLRKLKKLALHISEDDSSDGSTLLSHVLGLYVKEQDHDYLPRLTCLVLCQVDWTLLAHSLRQGKFPSLVEVRRLGLDDVLPVDFDPDNSPNWYELDPLTSSLWVEVMRSRSIRLFDDSIRFLAVEEYQPSTVALVNQLLQGLSQPIDARLTSHLEYLDLTSIELEPTTCEVLAGAFQSKNLCSLNSLILLYGATCDISGYAILGSFLHHEYLPILRFLSLGVNDDEEVLSRLECWRALFGAIPQGGLDKLESFWIGGSGTLGSSATMLHALADTIVLPSITSVSIEGDIRAEELIAIATAITVGVLPSLESLTFKSK